MKRRLITLDQIIHLMYDSCLNDKNMKILMLLFVNLVYTFTRTVWPLRVYQCPMLRLLLSVDHTDPIHAVTVIKE